ncbi:MAG: hypothetical protein ABUK01_12045 [Leptospirales bacterium]
MLKNKRIQTLLIIILFSIPAISFAQNKTGGVHGIAWGTSFENVLDHFRELAKNPKNEVTATILNVRPDEEILVKRNEIRYRYFFYLRPDIVLENKPKEEGSDTAEEAEGFEPLADEGTDDIPEETTEPATETTEEDIKVEVTNENFPRFFFMETKFAYVPSQELLELLKKRYGNPTLTKLDKDGVGAYVWELKTGYIVQWVDLYDKKPFSRSIYYISKTIMEEINRDYAKYEYTREIQTLRDILP